jgi:hypothetical protein
MATKKIKRFQEGGVSDKDRGLEASKEDKVGFFERLRMGNIDEEGSEAYNRFGAGRGKADRTPVEDKVGTPVARGSGEVQDSEKQVSVTPLGPDSKNNSVISSLPDRPKARPGEPGSNVKIGGRPSIGSSVPENQTQNSAAKPSPAKTRSVAPATSAPAKSSAYPMTKAQPTTKTYDRTGGPTADELANYKPPAKLTKKQQIEQEIDSIKPTAEQTQKGLEDATMLTGGIGLKALQGLAKKLAAPKLSKYSQEALPAPTKRLGYDKAGAFSRKRSERAEAQRKKMLKENAERYGLDEGAPGYEAAAGAVRKNLGGKDFSLKKGGSVKRSAPIQKMASGGMVSSASKRADGIATKGKTRCKMR